MSSIYKILQESFQGIRVIKAFSMEAYERRRFREATRDYAQRAQKVVTLEALADPPVPPDPQVPVPGLRIDRFTSSRVEAARTPGEKPGPDLGRPGLPDQLDRQP